MHQNTFGDALVKLNRSPDPLAASGVPIKRTEGKERKKGGKGKGREGRGKEG